MESREGLVAHIAETLDVPPEVVKFEDWRDEVWEHWNSAVFDEIRDFINAVLAEGVGIQGRLDEIFGPGVYRVSHEFGDGEVTRTLTKVQRSSGSED
jgi:hypothetical protein